MLHSMLNKGFAFVPVLYIISAVIFGVGATVVVTQQLSSDDAFEEIGSVLVLEDLSEDDVIDAKEIATTTIPEEIMATTTVEEVDVVVEEVIVAKKVSKPVETVHIQEVVPVVEIIKVTPEPIPVITEAVELTASTIVEDTSVEDEFARINELYYDQVRKESRSLTESIDILMEQYEIKESISEQGIDACEAIYDNAVASTESDAEYLKTYYSESSRGFATQPALYDNVDDDLEYDLKQLEIDLEYCNSRYELDSSIESDIKSIDRSQNRIMSKLNRDNAIESLGKIRDLYENLFKVTDKM